MGANIKNASQVEALVSELKQNGVTSVCIDHEGGRVLRIKDGSPSALVMGKERSARKYGQAHGQLLASLGIDTNLAPVADILDPVNGNKVIGDRSFGSDPILVAEMVAAYVEGLHESGVKAVLKHWPGHGSVSQDTHTGLGILNRSWREIENRENLPFIAGIKAGANNIMVGHIAVPAVDGTTPASRSKKLIDLLRQTVRQQTGKEIALFSDSITMEGVGKDPISATKAMLGAGLDRIIYIGQARQQVYEAAVQHFSAS
jgi:beta-N-acetylhexosaminidase